MHSAQARRLSSADEGSSDVKRFTFEEEEVDDFLEEGGPSDDDATHLVRPRTVTLGVMAATAMDEFDEESSAVTPISLWIFTSVLMSIFTKWLYEFGGFPYPLTLVALHMGFASLVTGALRQFGHLDAPSVGWTMWFIGVLPVGALYALALGSGNMAVARLSVSLIQMTKALMPMAALVFSCDLGWKQLLFGAPLFGSMVTIAQGELLWDDAGALFQVASVCAEALRLLVVQKLLAKQLSAGGSPLVSTALFAPPAALLLGMLAYVFEPGAASVLTQSSRVLCYVMVNTLAAFTLNVSVVLVVRRAGGDTLTLAGVGKDALSIVASIFALHNPVTLPQLCGYGASLVGLNLLDTFRGDRRASLPAIVRAALTSRRMLVIAVTWAMLFGIATTRLHLDHWDR